MDWRSMSRRHWAALLAVALILSLGWEAGTAWGEAPKEGTAKAAEQSTASSDAPAQTVRLGGAAAAVDPNEHPLMPVLRWGQESLKIAEKIQDYSATMVKRERIDDQIGRAHV